MDNSQFDKSTNIVKCIGTLSEINCKIESKNNNIIIRGRLVLRVKDKFIPFSFYTTKKHDNKYYQLLETFGIQYNLISNIDKDSYSLNESLINCELDGTIVCESQKQLLSINNPTKLFVVANINDYGFNINYITRSIKSSYIDIYLKAFLFKFDKELLSVLIKDNNGFPLKIDMNCHQDLLNKINIKSLCEIKLDYSNFDIDNNIILKSNEIKFDLIDIIDSDIIFTDQEIKGLANTYCMLELAKQNKPL